MKSTYLAALFLVRGLGKTSAFDYPSSVNDTTLHTNPFFLQIWTTINIDYAYHAVSIQQKDDGDWRIFIGPDSAVPAFQLADGILQVASPEGLTGAADGLVAAFGPETTDGNYVSKEFFFTNATATNQTQGTFELYNLSDDGLYSLLSHAKPPSTYNGSCQFIEVFPHPRLAQLLTENRLQSL